MSIPLHSDVYPAIDYAITAGTLKGKLAVIAGGSRGIGQQIAHCLAKTGASIAILSLSGNNTETKELCEKEGVKVGSWKVDITDEKETERVFGEIVAEMGQVDVLVNNAATQRRRPYAMDNVVDWWRVLEINLKGVTILITWICIWTSAHSSLCVLFSRFCRVCENGIQDVLLILDHGQGPLTHLLQRRISHQRPL